MYASILGSPVRGRSVHNLDPLDGGDHQVCGWELKSRSTKVWNAWPWEEAALMENFIHVSALLRLVGH